MTQNQVKENKPSRDGSSETLRAAETDGVAGQPACEHCGGQMSMPSGLCAGCFLEGHRSYPGDKLTLHTPDCPTCQMIVEMESEAA